MNEMNLNLSLFSGLGIPTAPTAQPQSIGVPAAGGFENLLDLMSDMTVADEQSLNLNSANEEALMGVQDDPLEALKGNSLALNGIQKDAILNKESLHVGQPKPALAETKESSDKLVSLQDIMLTGAMPAAMLSRAEMATPFSLQMSSGQPSLPQQAVTLPGVQGPQQLDPQSVQMWALGLGNGDIKAVSLGQSEVVAKPESELSSDFLGEGKAAPKASSFPESLKKPQKSEGAHAIQLNRFSWSENLAAQPEAKSADLGMQMLRQDLPQVLSKDEPKKNAVMPGGDFVLGQLNAQPASGETPVALFDGSQLGEVGDRRISPEAMNFVANKVESLKARGGGTLRVELNPNGMGSLEIRVSMKKGGLDVQLLAERPETLSILKGSQVQLTEKLQEIAPVKLDLVQFSAKEIQSRSNQPFVRTESTPSSQELMSIKDPSMNRMASSVTEPHSTVNNKVTAMNTIQEAASPLESKASRAAQELRVEGRESVPANGDSWGREERREKARTRWEEFFEGMKKSA